MSKKDKKEKEFKVLKINGKDVEAFERSGLNTSVLEGGNVYFLAKEKKDEEGNKYYKPVLKDGALYVTAVSKQKADTKFEKMIGNYAGACVAAGTFASIEAVDGKIAKPSVDEYLAKDKTPVDFSKVEDFLCVLPKESDLMKDVKDDVKGIFKAAKKVEKFAKKEVKELYELEDTNFATFKVEGNDLSQTANMWDAYDAIQEKAKEEDAPEEEQMPDFTEEDEEEEYDEEESEEEYDEDDSEEEHDDEETTWEDDEEEENEEEERDDDEELLF